MYIYLKKTDEYANSFDFMLNVEKLRDYKISPFANIEDVKEKSDIVIIIDYHHFLTLDLALLFKKYDRAYINFIIYRNQFSEKDELFILENEFDYFVLDSGNTNADYLKTKALILSKKIITITTDFLKNRRIAELRITLVCLLWPSWMWISLKRLMIPAVI